MPYKLSQTLSGHSSDVKAVVSPRDDLILSASRDTTSISWTRSSSTDAFAQAATLRPGDKWVNSLAYIPPTPDAPEGYVVTGGQDGLINVFSLANPKPEPSFTLVGHSANVPALHALPDGTIISGSLDHTARVWKNFDTAYELRGHTHNVWAVLALSSEQFLTGSADNSIKMWDHHKNVKTFTGHTQPVRGLITIPDIGFASCSNDGDIRVWTLEGDVVYTLSGHTAFVYCLALLPTGEIASTGEDRSLRIWRDGECVQTIVHPAVSVWAVSAMPNGDIVTGASDGEIRVFSASEERWASAEELKAYDERIANTALPAQQVGDIKKSDLPGEEALQQPGRKEGDVKMIQKNGIIEAYQWSNVSSSWQKIGDVVDAPGSGKKQVYQGREYDYVFDVDVQEGVPPLKLPYNTSENPYTAAQRFLQNNELPLTYLDEVVRFIEKNTQGVSLGGGGEFVDPFTGASRYQPAQTTAAAGGQEFMDPFTGASRYRAPGQTTAPPPPPVSTSSDPWTGGSRYAGSASVSSPPPQQPQTPTVALPVRGTLPFKQANIAPMRNKVFQFNETLSHEISTATLAMYPDERSLLEEVFLYLDQAVANTSPITAPSVSQVHIQDILALLERWPSGSRFPLIDLCRLVIGYCPDAYSDPAFREKFFRTLFDVAEWTENWQSPLSKQQDMNVLLLMRGIANAFQDNTSLGDSVWVNEILGRLDHAPYKLLQKAARVALGTLLFNLSCMGLRERLAPSLRAHLVALILQFLEAEGTESEPAYRLLVALGNTAYGAKQGQSLDAAQAGKAKEVVASVAAAFPEERLKSMARNVTNLL